MIGWRGPPVMSRRPSVKRLPLECAALRHVGEDMASSNGDPDDSFLSETPKEGDRVGWPKWPAMAQGGR